MIGGLSAGLSAAGSIVSGYQARRESSRNRKFQKNVLKNRYQWMTQDLIKAGINPIMATQLGAGGAPSGGVASQPDIGQALASGNSARAANRMARKQEQVLASEVAKNIAQSDQANSAKALNDSNAAYQNMINARTKFMNELYLDGSLLGEAALIADESKTVHGSASAAARSAARAAEKAAAKKAAEAAAKKAAEPKLKNYKPNRSQTRRNRRR
jgi:hypothetical protein